jgi:hypothetical protein
MLRALLIACGQRPELLVAVDQPLSSVAAAVDGAIKWARATVMVFPRDGEPDLVPSEILAALPAAVSFVPHDAMRSPLGPTRPDPLDGATRHELVKHARFMSLARGQEERHELATTLRAHMHCGAESAPAPP